ncbi:TPA: hypothetical protein ACIECZ_000831 [Enterococcus faecium]
MRNYWYVSLTNRYPQPNTDDPIRVVQSVQIKKKYSIIEMTREATPKEIDKCKLIYCGHGFFDEPNIQNNINKNLRDSLRRCSQKLLKLSIKNLMQLPY